LSGLALKREKDMREIAFKNLTSTAKRRRIISLIERTEKEGYLISSQKSIVYMVNSALRQSREIAQPEYYICKSYDSKEKIEKFSLRVKGASYILQEGNTVKVDFCHALRIEIRPAATVTA
jgi:hypothetical protein